MLDSDLAAFLDAEVKRASGDPGEAFAAILRAAGLRFGAGAGGLLIGQCSTEREERAELWRRIEVACNAGNQVAIAP